MSTSLIHSLVCKRKRICWFGLIFPSVRVDWGWGGGYLSYPQSLLRWWLPHFILTMIVNNAKSVTCDNLWMLRTIVGARCEGPSSEMSFFKAFQKIWDFHALCRMTKNLVDIQTLCLCSSDLFMSNSVPFFDECPNSETAFKSVTYVAWYWTKYLVDIWVAIYLRPWLSSVLWWPCRCSSAITMDDQVCSNQHLHAQAFCLSG